MRWPRVVAAVAAWLVVVVGTSTLVWVVISRAGADLSPSESPQAATTASAGPRPSGSSSPVAVGTRRTWQGPAGFVIATCDRGTIRLVSAQPVSGFHVEVKRDEGDELEVEFEARGDGRGGEVIVVARCASGIPKFSSRAHDD